MRILLIEDDPLLGDATEAGLSHDGYTVEWMHNGDHGDSALRNESFDGVVLDLGLPGKSGLDILQAMRGRNDTTPALILTARDSIEDRIKGLDSGADDYLIKPFDLDELSARLRALIRRAAGRSSPLIEIATVVLDPATHLVTLNNETVDFSQREFSLLQLLMEAAPRVLSRSYLEEHLYSWESDVGSNVLEVHIHNLRKKLGKTFIHTIRGVGYRVEEVR
jgi:DNA-binding response OmpR family regulator